MPNEEPVTDTNGKETEDDLNSEILRITNITSFNIDKLLNSEQEKQELIKLLQELKARNERDMQEEEIEIKLVDASDDLIERVEVRPIEGEAVPHHDLAFNDSDQVDLSEPELFQKMGENTAPSKNNSKINRVESSIREIYGVGEAKQLPISDSEMSDVKENSSIFLGNKIIPPLDSALPYFPPYEKRTPFDAQQFLERIRTMYNDRNVTRNYELLTCKSQSFTQRLAVMGEVLNN